MIHTDSDQIISSSVVQRKEFLHRRVSWLDRPQQIVPILVELSETVADLKVFSECNRIQCTNMSRSAYVYSANVEIGHILFDIILLISAIKVPMFLFLMIRSTNTWII